MSLTPAELVRRVGNAFILLAVITAAAIVAVLILVVGEVGLVEIVGTVLPAGFLAILGVRWRLKASQGDAACEPIIAGWRSELRRRVGFFILRCGMVGSCIALVIFIVRLFSGKTGT